MENRIKNQIETLHEMSEERQECILDLLTITRDELSQIVVELLKELQQSKTSFWELDTDDQVKFFNKIASDCFELYNEENINKIFYKIDASELMTNKTRSFLCRLGLSTWNSVV